MAPGHLSTRPVVAAGTLGSDRCGRVRRCVAEMRPRSWPRSRRVDRALPPTSTPQKQTSVNRGPVGSRRGAARTRACCRCRDGASWSLTAAATAISISTTRERNHDEISTRMPHAYSFVMYTLSGTSSTWTAGTGPASTMPRERRLGTRWVHARCCRCRRHSWSTGRRCGPFGYHSAIFRAVIHNSFGVGLPGRACGARRVRWPPQRLKKRGSPAAAHRATDGQVCSCRGVAVVRCVPRPCGCGHGHAFQIRWRVSSLST